MEEGYFKEAHINGCSITEMMGVPKTYDFLLLYLNYMNYLLKKSTEKYRRIEDNFDTESQGVILSEICSLFINCSFIYFLYSKGFKANIDGPSVVYNKINIVGNIVMIKPTHDSRSKRIALRVELYGCTLSKKRVLTLSRRRLLSYRNQSIDLLCKSMDWFLYDNGLRLERVKYPLECVNWTSFRRFSVILVIHWE